MSSAILTSTFTYTPPGTGTSATATLNVTSTYTAQEGGTVDIPDTTAMTTTFPLSFGSVNVDAQALYVKNTNNQDMILKINASASLYSIPPGGELLISHPAAASGGGPTPLLSADLVTTVVQSGDGVVSYQVFGV